VNAFRAFLLRIACTALLLALSFSLIDLSGCDRGGHPAQVGAVAPAFTITDGPKTISLSDYRGKVVLLNFWASWCPPCLEELPSLNALQQQMPGVIVLGVDFDDEEDAYHQFLQDHPSHFLTIRDAQDKSSHAYGTTRPPETYVIDKQGIIRRKFIGPQDWTGPEIENYLRNL
jgi:thiol-disulfide isomerase/thioredoxin